MSITKYQTMIIFPISIDTFNAYANQLRKRFINEKDNDQLSLSTLLDIFHLRENFNEEDIVKHSNQILSLKS